MIIERVKIWWKKLTFLSILIVILATVLSACKSDSRESEKTVYSVYVLNRDETKIEDLEYRSDTEDELLLLGELIEVMSKPPENVEYHEVVRGFMITGYSVSDGVATISVSEEYKKLTATTEVLTRAAIVRTLCQLDSIDFVMMKVKGRELKDANGIAIGAMNSDQFLDNEGNEINTYENVELILYFASEDGKNLVKAIRQVEYSSNISMERLLMEKLIGGPTGEGLYATINPNTKIENITIKDSICYVNLSEDFLIQQSNVIPEVAIYSVVNTLVELESVNKVQISIHGDTNLTFRESYELETLFERNLDIVKKKE